MPEKTRYFKVACRYFNYLSFDAREIAKLMQKLSCKVVAKLPPPEFGNRIGMAGYIAEKDRNLIYVDTDKQIFRVVSFNFVNITNSLSVLELIINEIKSYYDIEPSFYELAWELMIEVEKNVLEIFKTQSSRIPLLTNINSKLSSDFALFGIRLFDGVPNSPNWFDIRIEPNLNKNGKGYHIGVIYRDKDWNTFSSNVTKLPEIIMTTIDSIERFFE